MRVRYILGVILLFSILLFVIPTVTESSSLTLNYDNPSTDQLTVVSQAESIVLHFGEIEISSKNIGESDEPVNLTVLVRNNRNSESYSDSYKMNISSSGSISAPLAQDVIGSGKLSSSGFLVNKVTELEYEIQASHPETGTESVSDTIDIRVVSDPSTCSDILDYNQNPDNGEYIIDNNGNEVEVYCIFEPSGNLVAESYTMKYVAEGDEDRKTTRRLSDDNTCKDYGMQLFVPRSPEEYDIAKNYVSNIYGKDPSTWDSGTSSTGGGLGPMGLYYDETFIGDENSLSSARSPFTGEDVHSYHYPGGNTIDGGENGSGWLTFLDTDRFWISGGVIDGGEPNGDYTPETWLGFNWDNNGDVSNFNDVANAGYAYDSYLCTQVYQDDLGNN